jgi:hypothetical protein
VVVALVRQEIDRLHGVIRKGTSQRWWCRGSEGTLKSRWGELC